jgi:hypothetical protein
VRTLLTRYRRLFLRVTHNSTRFASHTLGGTAQRVRLHALSHSSDNVDVLQQLHRRIKRHPSVQRASATWPYVAVCNTCACRRHGRVSPRCAR